MVSQELKKHLKQVSPTIFEISQDYKEGMLVPARIYATPELIEQMDDRVLDQITNVAALPGIQKFSYCMPDAHSGYGFPIGGVAAFDTEKGIISPGGIGFDINCGMRLIKTNLKLEDVKPRIRELVDQLYVAVPAGVGRKGSVKLTPEELKEVATKGAQWCIQKGYGWEKDLEVIEARGRIAHANPEHVSEKALGRVVNQLGTLGSGNHYLEIQHAATINRPDIAQVFGIDEKDQVVIMVHCGSRGFGHQIGTDYLKKFLEIMPKYGIKILDRELACAPFKSPEGQEYYSAMACAANFAFANRQLITHKIREVFSKVFEKSAEELGMDLVYDVAHNIAKLETYTVDGKPKELLVHRKGSTRCFGPGHPEVPKKYQSVGQPVIIGGSMETGSYLLAGAESGETFGSTMHGSGRTMSRTQARKQFNGAEVQKKMLEKGIYVKAVSLKGLAEEVGDAYKNVDDVVNVMELAGVSKKVVRLKPIGNVKG
jgi:tRNA-splicing ligase RtcB (3'-phosphate/5'-hydroxy nucleic acid ligase)